MINENILGKCFLSSSSFVNPRILPRTTKYECPQLSPLIITSVPETNKIEPKSYPLFHAYVSEHWIALFTLSFFKVKVTNPKHTRLSAQFLRRRTARETGRAIPKSNYELFNCSNFNLRQPSVSWQDQQGNYFHRSSSPSASLARGMLAFLQFAIHRGNPVKSPTQTVSRPKETQHFLPRFSLSLHS